VDIAVDLLSRAAGTLTVSVRTPPNFLPRELYGLPLQALSVTNRYAPSPFLDTVGRLVQRLAVGDLRDTPLGASPEGMFTRLRRTGVNPAVDDGVFVPAVRDGRVTVIPAVVGLYPDGVVAADGSRTPADAVIAATGYGTGLGPLVGHLGAVDGLGHPVQYGAGYRRWAGQGLHFVGYSSPLTGHLREVGILARRAARRIARDPAPAQQNVPVPS
jgi:putative flavoprotein involved in K+ transport